MKDSIKLDCFHPEMVGDAGLRVCPNCRLHFLSFHDDSYCRVCYEDYFNNDLREEPEIEPAQFSIPRIKYLEDCDGMVYKFIDEQGKKHKIKEPFKPHFRDIKPAGMIRFLRHYPGKIGTFWYNLEGWPWIAKHKKCVPVEVGLKDSYRYRQL